MEKFEDVAVYLHPNEAKLRRLEIQALKYVLEGYRAKANSLPDSVDWLRKDINGNIPIVLKLTEWALKPLSSLTK